MATKTNGAEFKAFLNDEHYWIGDAYFEDELLVINGIDHLDNCDLDHMAIDDAASVIIHDGRVRDSVRYIGKDDPSLETFFKQWKKLSATQTLIIQFDKNRVEEITQALKALNVKIIK
jgi:hypothetical protein